jgi:hypothetical protein
MLIPIHKKIVYIDENGELQSIELEEEEEGMYYL